MGAVQVARDEEIHLAVDLGRIAKGWTVDRVARALAKHGPTLVDARGGVRAIGAIGGEVWPIDVQDPFEPQRNAPPYAFMTAHSRPAVSADAAGGNQAAPFITSSIREQAHRPRAIFMR